MKYTSSGYRPVATAAFAAIPLLMPYIDLNESTYIFKLANALSEQGWKVVASHPAAGSNVWIDAKALFASLPDRPPPVFEVMNPSDGFQYD